MSGNWTDKFTLKYKDNQNNLHGTTTTTHNELLNTFSSLYERRRIRKYYSFDIDEHNLFNLQLRWHQILYWSFAQHRMSIYYYWAIKILFYHKRDIIDSPYKRDTMFRILMSAFDVCSVRNLNIITYSTQIIDILCIIIGIGSITNLFIYIIVQWITFAIAILVWLFITCIQTYLIPIPKIVEPQIKSCYHQSLSRWQNKYNNMSVTEYIELIVGIGDNCKTLLIRCIFLFIYPMRLALRLYTFNCAEHTGMKWVIPDYYDIQEDISFFILKKLPASITENRKLMKCIYHILNAIVANVIYRRLRAGGKVNMNPNDMTQSYLLCVSKYLRHKCCINYNYKNNGIIDDEHTFNHVDICLKDYEYYQKLNGYVWWCSPDKSCQSFLKGLLGFYFRKTHKYMFPFTFLILLMNVSGLFMFIQHIYTSNFIQILPNYISDWMILFLLSIYLFGLILFLFWVFCDDAEWHWDKEFGRVTKDIIFWMDPQLLEYLNAYTFDSHDLFIASIIKSGIKFIDIYFNNLYNNKIYYTSITEVSNHSPFSDDILQIILDFVCEYYNDDSIEKQHVLCMKYDPSELEQEMDEMVQRISKICPNNSIHIQKGDDKHSHNIIEKTDDCRGKKNV